MQGTGIEPLGQALYNDIATEAGEAVELMEMRTVLLGTLSSAEPATVTTVKVPPVPRPPPAGLRATPEEFDVEEYLFEEADEVVEVDR